MFTNLIKKIADKDYLVFSQCIFDFTSGGEQNCNVRIINYDLNGNIQKEEDMDKIENDVHFLMYGSYMVVWLAQIFDDVISRKDYSFLNKMGSIFNILFDLNKKYNLSDMLALFDHETKSAVIEKHAAVQFKIHKITKASIVRVINIPITKETECQMYLFLILFDFFCKKYTNAYKLLGDGCNMLIKVITDNEFSTPKPFQIIAYEITNKMMADKMGIDELTNE